MDLNAFQVFFLFEYDPWDLGNTEELYGTPKFRLNMLLLFAIHAVYYKGEIFN